MPRRSLLVALFVSVAALAGCSSTPPAPAEWTASGAPAPSPARGAVWVANESDGTLSVLDAATGALRASVAGVPGPHNVQASADGAAVWAVTGTDQVIAVDGNDLSLTAAGMTDRGPAHVVATTTGGILVTASAQPSVYQYDARLRPVRRIPLTGAPHGMRVSADGRTAVVANTGAGTLDVVDVQAGAVTARIPVGTSPIQSALSADGRVAYVSLAGTREVARVDLGAGRVTARVRVPDAPAQIFLTSTDRLLVANQGTAQAPGTTLSVLDPATLASLALVQVGSGPHGVVSDPDGLVAWVSNMFDGTVSTVDLARAVVTGTVRVGASPNGITFSPARVSGGVPTTVTLEPPAREDRDGHSHGHAQGDGSAPFGHGRH